MNERAVVFDCEGSRLVGILSEPPVPAEIALLNIVGGPQYRAGSHRQFVHLTRALAEKGFAAMRFDARGMGDSDGDQRSFENIHADVAAAIDALCAALPSLRQVVLCGLCDGASAALLYWRATRDPRVRGLVLMNPWVRTGTTQARTRIKHYYAQRLMQGAFWRKLLSGKVAAAAGTEVLQNLSLAIKGAPVSRGTHDSAVLPLARRMALAWAGFGQRVLLVLSEQDYTAKEFLEAVLLDENLRSCMTAPSLSRIDVEGADHTFSQPGTRKFVEAEVVRWLRTASDKDSANLR